MNRHIVCITALLGLPATALADTFFDLHIHASACRPILEDMSKVKLSDGAWVFDTGQSGTVTLYCPLHLASPDDIGDSASMAVMRLWYMDPDATAVASRVSAALMRRRYDASTDLIVGSAIHSNSNNDAGFARYTTTQNHSADFELYSYHVEVTMVRTNTSIAPAFVGLDWEPPAT